MHLTSLRLHGFKSFAAVTELPFRPGLTAIVGPNGSGKSNIADAIRWVLGEQSIRSLRGMRAQDVIFSGNDRRRALGFADVVIELDHSGGELPLALTSVSIARRIHRPG
ncbi:MAG: AAA family ATPase, partial [Clostridia bacterium]